MQREGIKIGGSGGGWKSRLKCVDGCSNRVTVREIALVVSYYFTSRWHAAAFIKRGGCTASDVLTSCVGSVRVMQ